MRQLTISVQMLLNEAGLRNYEILFFNKTNPGIGNPVIECRKGNHKILFKDTLMLSPIVSRYLELDKITTYDLLSRINLPLPPSFILRRSDAADNFSVELCEFLHRNSPIVVKPSNTDHGDGISIGISNKRGLRDAVDYAMQSSRNADIILQKQVFGREFRFLVLRNRVIAVANRCPPFVVGNGINTVRELIDIKNSDPRRGKGHGSPLTIINIDEIAHFLGKSALDETPSHGEKIELLKTSNLSRGGESIDFTDEASAYLKDLAITAAHECLVGLAGVDIITDDIHGNSGFIIEVNAAPGLRMHQFPSIGQSRNVAAMIFDELERQSS